MKLRSPHSQLPTLKEIREYHQGTLGDQRRAEIDRLSAHDELVADALDGYKALPAYDSVPRFPGADKSISWWQLNGWWFAAIIVIIGGLASAVLSVRGTRESTQTASAAAFIPFRTELPAEEVTAPMEFKNESQDSPPEPVIIQTTGNARSDGDNFEQFAPIPLNSEMMIISDSGERRSQGIVESYVRMVAVPIVVIRHYKIADYTQIRRDAWSVSPMLTGTAADRENKSSSSATSEDHMRTVPYLSYIEHCLTLMDDGRRREADGAWDVVLESYPDDINALFFGGLNAYHSGDFKKALERLERAEQHTFRTYREEARFYKARALLKLGRLDEGRSLLESIAQGAGFYREQAQGLLDRGIQ